MEHWAKMGKKVSNPQTGSFELPVKPAVFN